MNGSPPPIKNTGANKQRTEWGSFEKYTGPTYRGCGIRQVVAVVVDEKSNEVERLARIKKEIKRLNNICKNLDKHIKASVKSLVENIAFMTITLEDLQVYINGHGVTTLYQNGENQWGTKKSPEVEVHIAITKNHTVAMKQLLDALPKSKPKDESDGFDEFVSGRDEA